MPLASERPLHVPVFASNRRGGVERYTWESGIELAALGHDVTFVAPRSASSAPVGVKLRAVGSRNGGRGAAAMARQIITYGFRVTPRLLATRSFCYGPLGAHYARGVITAHAVHGAWVRRRQELGGRGPSTFDHALLAIERLTYRTPWLRVTTVSSRAAAEIADTYGRNGEDIAVIPPAVDTDAFRPMSASQREAVRVALDVDDRFVLGAVANYASDLKNIDALVTAAAAMDVTLLVVGVDEVRQPRLTESASRLGADLRLLGSVDDMSRFYGALDLFAQPSFVESYGMSAHEAMAMGVPTVVSDTCGIAGTATPGLHLEVVDALDVEALTETLMSLQVDGCRRDRLGRTGAAWAAARTWSDVARELDVVMNEVASS